MFFVKEYTWDAKLHIQAAPHIAMGIALPLFFATFSLLFHGHWAATSTTVVYTVMAIAQILILPFLLEQSNLCSVYHPSSKSSR